MTQSDDAILNLLLAMDEHGVALPPAAIAHALDAVSCPTVERRLPKLEAVGLVRRFESPRGYREITPLGRRYLESDLTEEELEALQAADIGAAGGTGAGEG